MQSQPFLNDDNSLLGHIALRFRSAQSDADRRQIAKEYGQVVEHLIQGRQWNEMPPSEDQLPDEYMPTGFVEFWSRQ